MIETIKLEREYVFSGKNVKEINLNFEDLSGKDLIMAEKDFKQRSKGTSVKELEDGWLVTVAGVASGLKYGDLLTLKGKDYIKILNAARNFLLVSDSEENTTNTESVEREEIEETSEIE